MCPALFPTSLLKDTTFFGENFLDALAFLASNILIPLGGLAAVILVGWRWGTTNALNQLKQGAYELFERQRWIGGYFWFCFKYTAPILIGVVFLHALGLCFLKYNGL